MSKEDINKNYNIPHKLKKAWEDIRKLVALENRLLKKIEYLDNKVSILWKMANKK